MLAYRYLALPAWFTGTTIVLGASDNCASMKHRINDMELPGWARVTYVHTVYTTAYLCSRRRWIDSIGRKTSTAF